MMWPFNWIRWLGDEAIVEAAKAGIRGVGKVVTGAAQKTVERRVAPAEMVARLNADIIDIGTARTEHLTKRLRDAKAAHHENWLTKLVCTAVYEVPGIDDPEKMIELVNRAAEDDAQWEGLIERLDQDWTLEKLAWLRSKVTPSAATRDAVITGGNNFATWLNGVTDRYRR